MPTYMLLINYDPTQPSDGSPSKQPEHAKLMEEMRSHGHHRSGGGLAPASMYARRVVQQTDGQPLLIDGPFAETKEVVGGYYVVDCSEDEAIDYARRIPVDSRSWIEIRRLGVYQEG